MFLFICAYTYIYIHTCIMYTRELAKYCVTLFQRVFRTGSSERVHGQGGSREGFVVVRFNIEIKVRNSLQALVA